MTKTVALLVAVVVTLSVLVAAGPTIVALAHAAVPLVLVVGLVVILARLAWYFTGRW